jgi:hypothetical protein
LIAFRVGFYETSQNLFVHFPYVLIRLHLSAFSCLLIKIAISGFLNTYVGKIERTVLEEYIGYRPKASNLTLKEIDEVDFTKSLSLDQLNTDNMSILLRKRLKNGRI